MMDQSLAITLIVCAFLLGMVVFAAVEGRMLHFARKRGYRHAVQDILRDHIYQDVSGQWHQLNVTWWDVTPHKDSQKKQTL